MKEPGKVSRMFAAGMEKVRVFTKKTERKAQDWSSQSVLKVEVTQLNYRRDKLISKLGEEVYDSFVTLDHGRGGPRRGRLSRARGLQGEALRGDPQKPKHRQLAVIVLDHS